MAKKKCEMVNIGKIAASLQAQGVAVSFTLAKLDGISVGLKLRYPDDQTIQKAAKDIDSIMDEIRVVLWPEYTND